MLVIITKDYDEMSKKAAEIVKEEMLKKQKSGMPFKLGLATGSTPLGLYKELIRMHKEEGLDFSTTISFNLDEYVGLPPEHEQSYHYFMQENLFKHININPQNIHIPDGMAKDLEKHCREYEEAIKSVGGIDLQILGIGRDGHIAFNEPGSSLASRTSVVVLAEETIQDNSRFFKSIDEVPKFAVTMGVGTILECKTLLLLANGKGKAEAVAKAIEGPVCSEITASALQLHPDAIVIIDEEAATKLKRREYYRHVYKLKKQLAA